MKKFLSLMVISAVCPMLLSGCVGNTRHPVMMGNTSQERIAIFQDNYGYENMVTSYIPYICEDYYQLQNFKEFERCSAVVEDRVDTLTRYDSELMNDYLQRAGVAMSTGNFPKALEYAKAAKRVYFDECPMAMPRRELDCYGYLSLAYALNGDHKNALHYLQQLKSVEATSILGMSIYIEVDDINRSTALWSARVHLALKDFKNAHAAIEKFLNFKHSGADAGLAMSAVFAGLGALTLQPELIFYGVAFTGMSAASVAQYGKYMLIPYSFVEAKTNYETGNLTLAKQQYDTLLTMPEFTSFATMYPTALHDRGVIASKENNSEKAEEFFTKAIAIVESRRATLTEDAAKIGFVWDKQILYKDMIDLLIAQKRDAEAFAYAERSKARALVDMLASSEQFTKSMPATSKQAYAELQTAQQKALAFFMDKEATTKTRGLVVVKTHELQKRDPRLASLVTVSSVDPKRIQTQLAHDDVLIEYYEGNEWLAFVVTPKSIRAVRLGKPDVKNMVANFRKDIQDRNSTAYKRSGEQLVKAILSKPLGYADTSKLTVVPHGALHYLPFSGLPHGKNFIADKYSVRLIPSASVLEFIPVRKSVTPESLLVVGNPKLRSEKFNLPYAEKEATAISSRVSGAKLLVQEDAREDVLKRESSKYAYLHFATHALFTPETPELSGLLLRGGANDDGLLTAAEIYGMKLKSKLVTLSACETGLGDIANGDDVLGLTRALLYAGADSVVTSFWKVDDKSTSKLMVNFYNYLGKYNKRSALQKARKSIRSGKYRHPYYWAAFELTGAE